MARTKSQVPDPINRMTAARADCAREAFLEAASAAAVAVPKKTPKPALEHLLLVAGGESSAEVHATNLEVGIRVRVLGLSAARPVRVLLPKDRTLQILRSAQDEQVALDVRPDDEVQAGVETDGTAPRFRLSGERWKYDLESPPASDFPEVPAFEATAYHAVAAADFRRAIDRTIFATDSQSTRYALGGVLMLFGNSEVGGDALTLVATDGHRLAKQIIPAEMVEGGAPRTTGGIIVPVRVLKILHALVADDDPPVHVAAVGAPAQGMAFRGDRVTIHSRLVEGRFPRWEDVMPQGTPEASVRAKSGLLALAFQQAEVATTQGAYGVACLFSEGVLRLRTEAADVGNANVELTGADVQGQARIRFDVRFAAEALACLDPELDVTLGVADAKTPGLLTTDDGYQHALMPLNDRD
jgi:DNA polymerase III subunit beta